MNRPPQEGHFRRATRRRVRRHARRSASAPPVRAFPSREAQPRSARPSAQGTHKWSSRFRPSTISERCTDASSWQRWQVMEGRPKSRGVSAPLLLFDRLDLIAHPSGGLVILGRDGALQIIAQLHQRGLSLSQPRSASGCLPEWRVASWMFSSIGINSSRKTS